MFLEMVLWSRPTRRDLLLHTCFPYVAKEYLKMKLTLVRWIAAEGRTGRIRSKLGKENNSGAVPLAPTHGALPTAAQPHPRVDQHGPTTTILSTLLLAIHSEAGVWSAHATGRSCSCQL
jgi:hypothetical protein